MPTHLQAKHTPAPIAAPAAAQFSARGFEEETEQVEEQAPEVKELAGGADAPPSEPSSPPADGGSVPPPGDGAPSSNFNFLDMPLRAEEAGVQAKLTMGQPGNKYEREADQTAAQVMRMPDPQVEDPLKREAGTPAIQRKGSGEAAPMANLQSRLNQQAGNGSPLPDGVQTFMEPRFGQDFSQVRVHSDSSAVQMNKELGAKAFAYKNDIYFNAGEYNPSSIGGQELLAHELTHTIQQTGGIRRNKDNKKDLETGQALETEQVTGSTNENMPNTLSENPGKPHSPVVQPKSLNISAVSPQVQGFFGDQDWVKDKASEKAEDYLPGYSMLTFVLGKDPITDKAVARSATKFVEAALDLVPNGDKIFKNLKDSGALNKVFTWLEEQIKTLSLTWRYIKGLFRRAFDSLDWGDLRNPMGAAEDILNIFLPPITRLTNFLIASAKKVMEMALEAAIALASGSSAAERVMGILRSAGNTFNKILEDPSEFLSNLLEGFGKGFKRFRGNIAQHLQSGLIGWLTGALGPMGIQIPEDIFSGKGIFSLVTQVLGLTWDYVRRKAVKMFGEKKVSAMEESVDLLQTMRDGGADGLWEQIKDQMGDLKQSVMGEIKNMLIVEVIRAGVTWVLSLFSPASAFVRAAKMIFDVVMFVIDRASQIMEMVNAVTESIGAIANGNTNEMGAAIENSLATSLPVAIGLMASVLGLGNLAKRVTRIIDKIRERIDEAIEWVLEKVRRLFKGKKNENAKKSDAENHENSNNDNQSPWWNLSEPVNSKNRKEHTICFEGKGKNATLMIHSTPRRYIDFVREIRINPNDEEQYAARIDALNLANEIDRLISSFGATTNQNGIRDETPNFRNLLNKLARTTSIFVLRDDGEVPVSSPPDFGGLHYGFATSMKIDKLTRIGPPGSDARAENLTMDILKQRKSGSRPYYVKGHLLSQELHGRGTTWQNLTPLTQTANINEFEFRVERPLKRGIENGQVYSYEVNAVYRRSLNVHAIRHFQNPQNTDPDKTTKEAIVRAEVLVPVELTGYWQEVDYSGKPLYGRVNFTIPNDIDQNPSNYIV